MPKPIIHRISVPVLEDIYFLLQAEARKNRTSVAQLARKLLEKEIKKEQAFSAQDIFLATLRKALRAELQSTENRIANLGAKGAISAATAENMCYVLLKNQGFENPREVRDAARKRAVQYLRENLKLLLLEYEEE